MGAHHSLRPHYSRLVALGCAVGLLAGCTGGGSVSPSVSPTADAAESSPSASPRVSVSVSPSPSATELSEEEILAALPEGMGVDSFPSATTFIEYFVNESQNVLRTHDTAAFSALSNSECGFCVAVLDDVEQFEREGRYLEGGEISFDPLKTTGGLQEDETWVIDVPLEIDEMNIVDASGTLTETVPAEMFLARFHLAHLGERWEVIEVAPAEQS